MRVQESDVLRPPSPPPLAPSTEPDDTPVDTPALDSESAPQQLAHSVQSPVREPRRAPAPTERMVTRSARTNEDAFVTSTEGTTARPAGAAQSVHTVDEVMKRHREEMGRCSTANISVKEAFRTRGDEAKKVIVSELRQMIDKRVWAPVMGQAISDAESIYY